MNSWISRPCDSPCEELDAGDQQPCLGAFDGFLEVLGEAPVASEPCERPFDEPGRACRIAAIPSREAAGTYPQRRPTSPIEVLLYSALRQALGVPL